MRHRPCGALNCPICFPDVAGPLHQPRLQDIRELAEVRAWLRGAPPPEVKAAGDRAVDHAIDRSG